MNFSDVEKYWGHERIDSQKTGPQFQRALAKHDLSLLAEFAVGAWLASCNYRLEKAELCGDRVMSPRRQNRAKTCDFEITLHAEPSSLPVFVEVKHTVSRDTHVDLKAFFQSAYLKGARWLVVVIYSEDLRLPATLSASELSKEKWSQYVSDKQVLKYRRNGLVKVTLLNLS